MESVLGQLVTVPGVVGGMIYDGEGTVLSRTFPPIFDEALLAGAARVLVDGAAGLETVTGKLGLLDLRFADARLVVRPMAGASLILLCTAQTNLQLLNISTSVAVPKIERMVAARLPGGAASLGGSAPEALVEVSGGGDADPAGDSGLFRA